MKKENRQMAQEQRRKEREAEARKQKTVKILVPTVVIAAIAVVVIGIVVTSGKSTSTTSGSSTASASSAAAASAVSASETSSSASAASSATSSSASSTASSSAAKTLNNDPMTVAEEGDTVNIDYVGTIDGVEFDGGSTQGKGADLVLGSGTYIPGFEDQIVGHSAGETFDVTVTFPDDYGVADLAGKEAVFKTKLNGVYQ